MGPDYFGKGVAVPKAVGKRDASSRIPAISSSDLGQGLSVYVWLRVLGAEDRAEFCKNYMTRPNLLVRPAETKGFHEGFGGNGIGKVQSWAGCGFQQRATS